MAELRANAAPADFARMQFRGGIRCCHDLAELRLANASHWYSKYTSKTTAKCVIACTRHCSIAITHARLFSRLSLDSLSTLSRFLSTLSLDSLLSSSYFASACELEDGWSCHRLSLMLRTDERLLDERLALRSDERARALLSERCFGAPLSSPSPSPSPSPSAGERPTACFQLQAMEHVAQDVRERARREAKQGLMRQCREAGAASPQLHALHQPCLSLARLHDQDQEPELAWARLTDGCLAGESDCCTEASGRASSITQMFDYAIQACELRWKSCATLGVLYRDRATDSSIPLNVRSGMLLSAKEAFTRCCKAGVPQCCDNVRQLSKD